MNKILKISMGIMIVCIILASAVPAVKADGMPMTKIELHGTLRENRQLAYVSVNENGETEKLDLFLSVVSLYPGNNVSIMIPLRTSPSAVNGQEMSEADFRQQRNYDGILEMANRQNHGFEELGESTAEITADMAKMQVMGMLYFMVIGFGGAGGGDYYEIAEGVSMEVLSFNSTDSLADFYAEQGVPVPEKVEEIIEEYGDFNVGIINAITRPPIEQERFDRLTRECPMQLDRFRDFVEKNPTIESYGYYDMAIDSEMQNILQSIPDDDLTYDFYELMMATYGFGQNQGTLISFDLPLYDGQAFFPLGTTPAWHGVHKTQVIFEVPDNMAIDFNHEGEDCFSNGKHYYTWAFEFEAPDYDLEGEVKDAGFLTSINWLGRKTNEAVYNNAGLIGMSIGTILLGGAWSIFLWGLSRTRKWQNRGRKQYTEIALLGFSCMATSFIGTIIFGIFVAVVGIHSLERRYLPPEYPHTKEGRILGIELVFWLLMGFVGFINIMVALEISLVFLMGVAGAIAVLAHYMHIRLYPEKNEPLMNWGIWGIYIASLLIPTFFMLEETEICLSVLLCMVLAQTTLYLLLMREAGIFYIGPKQ